MHIERRLTMEVVIEINGSLGKDEVISLYRSNGWSSAEKPEQLMAALKSSHSVVTARFEKELIGLANSLSDGHLVVYYPHLLVNPKYHRMGVATKIMQAMSDIYRDFHQ